MNFVVDGTAPIYADLTLTPVTSDGGSTSYYELPPHATELNDLIEHKGMSFALGNIFKACYRFGEKDAAKFTLLVKKSKPRSPRGRPGFAC
jgi:hypothetical protein